MTAAAPVACSVEGCERPRIARGVCRSHYNALDVEQREALPRVRRRPGDPVPVCSAEGCDRPSKTRGLCHRHYMYALRHRIIEATPIGARAGHLPCIADDCDEPYHAKGLCYRHYRQERNAINRAARAARRVVQKPPVPAAPPPPPPAPDVFVVTAAYTPGMSEARQRRRVLEQVVRLPEVEGLRLHGDWSWRLVPGRDGRPVELVGTVRASSPEFPAPDPERTPHRWTAALSTSTSTTPPSSPRTRVSR